MRSLSSLGIASIEVGVRDGLLEEARGQTDRHGRPDVQKEIVVLLRFSQRNLVHHVLFPPILFGPVQPLPDRPANPSIERRQPCDHLALCDGRREQDFPHLHGGETVRVLGDQSMEKGRAASRIADDEDRRPDLLVPVSSKEDVVQEKTEPDRELEKWIHKVEGNKNSDTPRCPPPVGQPKG